jgi:hypothetical protein
MYIGEKLIYQMPKIVSDPKATLTINFAFLPMFVKVTHNKEFEFSPKSKQHIGRFYFQIILGYIEEPTIQVINFFRILVKQNETNSSTSSLLNSEH